MHGVRVPMWQTQSAGPVRTAHMSVLLTVNIMSHNPARSSSDNIPSYDDKQFVDQTMSGTTKNLLKLQLLKAVWNTFYYSKQFNTTLHNVHIYSPTFPQLPNIFPDPPSVNSSTWVFQARGHRDAKCTALSTQLN